MLSILKLVRKTVANIYDTAAETKDNLVRFEGRYATIKVKLLENFISLQARRILLKFLSKVKIRSTGYYLNFEGRGG